jgi:excisionase family DNA binding protein
MSEGHLNKYLTIDELGEFLKMKRSTLYSLVENGELPHYRIGRLIRFKLEDVEFWMESHKSHKKEKSGDKKAKEIIRSIKRPSLDSFIKKTIDEAKKNLYVPFHGEPDQSRGLGKEVEDGNLS